MSAAHLSAAARCAAALGVAWLVSVSAAHAADFTLEQVLSAPYTSDVVAAPAGHSFAWVSDSRGRRNATSGWVSLRGQRWRGNAP